jgi:putative acetyltransferase
VTIVGASPNHSLLLGLAPVAVLPEYQKQGIGTSLIRQGLADCVRWGCQAVFVLGSPQYYSRFGFTAAKHQGLACEYDVSEEAFRVLELAHGALAQSTGTVKYHPEFSRLT